MKPWIRLDVDFLRNPKIRALAPLDKLAYLSILLWCKEQGTGGLILPEIPFRTFAERAPQATRQRLIDAELLVAENGALLVPNFDRKQPQTEDERRAKDARRKQLARKAAREAAENVRGRSADVAPDRKPDTLAGARATVTETETPRATGLPENEKRTAADEPATSSEGPRLGGDHRARPSTRELLDQLKTSDFGVTTPAPSSTLATAEEAPPDDLLEQTSVTEAAREDGEDPFLDAPIELQRLPDDNGRPPPMYGPGAPS